MNEIVPSLPESQENEKLTHFVRPDETFTLDPDLIWDQASSNAVFPLMLRDGTFGHFLVFARMAMTLAPDGVCADAQGNCLGVEVVAYLCEDEFGAVIDWERRYEVKALVLDSALNRLRFQLVNGLAVVSNYEGELGDWEAN